MAKTDIFEYVTELEEEIQESRYAKLSKSMKVIEEKIVLEIIEDIKGALHEELDASSRSWLNATRSSLLQRRRQQIS